ncbi:MAG: hypothetical protein IPK13_21395 [Deltaproteobacteria bacterium]|nr:hypothetical protein [Deltaproteobacteria bacterium]
MRPTRVASLLFEMAVSRSSRETVRDAVKSALDSARSERRTADHATLRARSIVDESRRIRYGAPPAEFEDDIAELWFPQVDDDEIRRANDALFARLPREYDELLRHYTELERPPTLPDDYDAFLAMSFASKGSLGFFASGPALLDQKVLEVGAQAGEMAKRFAPYAKTWLGVDASVAALKIARLVCPENATFLHPSKHVSLAVHHGSVDTVVGRKMFVHQTLDEARALLGFVEPFLVTGGRVFAEFYFPNSDRPRPHTYPAPHPPADVPGAVFAYSRSNVETLIRNRPLRIIHDDERPSVERRYVILEKTELDY